MKGLKLYSNITLRRVKLPFSERMKRWFNRNVLPEPDPSKTITVISTPLRTSNLYWAFERQMRNSPIHTMMGTPEEMETLESIPILPLPDAVDALAVSFGIGQNELYQWQVELLKKIDLALLPRMSEMHPMVRATKAKFEKYVRISKWRYALSIYSEMISRKLSHRHCWDCDRNLHFFDFTQANYESPVRHLKKLWKSPYVELLCCTCKRKREMINIADKIIDEEFNYE